MSHNEGAPMIPSPVTKVDLHCHSTASQHSRLGVQRALGLPECATPPEEVYELAKRRGMDFVTITDHDTIAGVLELSGRPDVFLSEELTTWFRGEPQAVHVLCWGITPDDHGWLQAHAHDVESVAEYLHGNSIACALAHPFYAVEAPLTAGHRRRLARLFGVWETRNGARARELNMPAAVYIETHGGAGVGGSDDHAGVDIGRTWTETPPASTPEEFLGHIRRGDASARGEQGSAAKWTHAAMALTVRALGRSPQSSTLDPQVVLSIVERVMSQGDARSGAFAADLGPAQARALLQAWLDALGLDLSEPDLLAWMQDERFSHAELWRRAKRVHERRLRDAVQVVLRAAREADGYLEAASSVFEACVPAIPYAPSAAFLGREKGRLITRESEPGRVALVADGLGRGHGVTHTLDELRDRGVPGFEVDVIGTDANVDRRLPAVAEAEIPFYPGLSVGVPSLHALVDTLAEGRYDIVHLCSPGPAGVAAALVARIMELPLVGSYHTELGVYAGLRSGDRRLRVGMDAALAALYGRCDVVLSPSKSADGSLRALGVHEGRIERWDRGVDLTRFSPALSPPGSKPGGPSVLYAGRLTREKGVDLLASAFLRARAIEPRLHLLVAGDGPEEPALRARLGEHATFLGWLDERELARVYAAADVFLFASQTDTFGQVILEAQASGLAVVAVAQGGPLSLIEEGRSGRLCAPDPEALAAAVTELVASPVLRARLSKGGLAAVSARTWERSLERLAGGYRRALGEQTLSGGESRRTAA
ncbi:MAG TPA: glycosyltransferase [Thermoleophilaceae bacterium]|jgi:glycosyltransferase involved in cell wall biosynthesis/predicted metal-dependent phosphoesterase TrpH|nr:glycosyltransferase [Thermoleophilaceae bacterium]